MSISASEIKLWFDQNGYPSDPATIHPGVVIFDSVAFVNGHTTILNANPKKFRFLPYYNRLFKFYQLFHGDLP